MPEKKVNSAIADFNIVTNNNKFFGKTNSSDNHSFCITIKINGNKQIGVNVIAL